MSATCNECGAGAPVFEGFCEKCLDWFAEYMPQAEKPATELATVRSYRDASKVHASAINVPPEACSRHRRGDPTMPLAQHRAARAYIVASEDFDALEGLYDATEAAWREWAKWETVQRWKARRKAAS